MLHKGALSVARVLPRGFVTTVGNLLIPIALWLLTNCYHLPAPAARLGWDALPWLFHWGVTMASATLIINVMYLSFTHNDEPVWWAWRAPLVHVTIVVILTVIIPKVTGKFPIAYLAPPVAATGWVIVALGTAAQFSGAKIKRHYRQFPGVPVVQQVKERVWLLKIICALHVLLGTYYMACCGFLVAIKTFASGNSYLQLLCAAVFSCVTSVVSDIGVPFCFQSAIPHSNLEFRRLVQYLVSLMGQIFLKTIFPEVRDYTTFSLLLLGEFFAAAAKGMWVFRWYRRVRYHGHHLVSLAEGHASFRRAEMVPGLILQKGTGMMARDADSVVNTARTSVPGTARSAVVHSGSNAATGCKPSAPSSADCGPPPSPSEDDVPLGVYVSLRPRHGRADSKHLPAIKAARELKRESRGYVCGALLWCVESVEECVVQCFMRRMKRNKRSSIVPATQQVAPMSGAPTSSVSGAARLCTVTRCPVAMVPCSASNSCSTDVSDEDDDDGDDCSGGGGGGGGSGGDQPGLRVGPMRPTGVPALALPTIHTDRLPASGACSAARRFSDPAGKLTREHALPGFCRPGAGAYIDGGWGAASGNTGAVTAGTPDDAIHDGPCQSSAIGQLPQLPCAQPTMTTRSPAKTARRSTCSPRDTARRRSTVEALEMAMAVVHSDAFCPDFDRPDHAASFLVDRTQRSSRRDDVPPAPLPRAAPPLVPPFPAEPGAQRHDDAKHRGEDAVATTATTDSEVSTALPLGRRSKLRLATSKTMHQFRRTRSELWRKLRGRASEQSMAPTLAAIADKVRQGKPRSRVRTLLRLVCSTRPEDQPPRLSRSFVRFHSRDLFLNFWVALSASLCFATMFTYMSFGPNVDSYPYKSRSKTSFRNTMVFAGVAMAGHSVVFLSLGAYIRKRFNVDPFAAVADVLSTWRNSGALVLATFAIMKLIDSLVLRDVAFLYNLSDVGE